ncbi:MAG: ATP-binding protein [Epsilonproteobacteria bacterium]|nr:ATP-binding protein [Campylobacterota bacterium]PIP10087.1 MAG: ATPase [Sulfurimonas sp. CG23_combo_of_CG06-09_8_20_14_all_36_33]PIS26629.1 MAG: ATPase [Sulfurimonas sp. CG08_land_8_20_14_0_20_36_33]PIU33448.1 MAG: ATPase [Sulfurimonas sp. CG07_land_8_20_14_0_80_36_56]PIV05634.1 MAG: ATPase [Sulfurimonas sp. CG03_land_8_20_14_0_80_36_25]PIV35287.1 MAG: ATPase [Sulfurimonas sp. CG02_land_8_20_14_3_00_36_67]PIV60370.1 MAG: ATPase [Sulfurimonas sp. CG01_land_8_20_14_3_00_36_23]PIW23908.1 MAG
MKFYNREKELENLREIEHSSKESSKMTVIVGRRRIGKTKLIQEAYKEKVYLFVSKKNEVLLCEEFISIIQKALDVKLFGQITKFIDLFEYLMELAKTKSFTLVIDEFQEFLQINDSIYSDMQNIWDSYKEITKINLILSGSIYSLMKKIFEDKKEPLFGRANNKIHLKPFTVKTIKEIMQENYPAYTNDDLLCFYILTGGVAKYVEILVDKRAYTLEQQLNLVFDEHSLFLEEGKNLLVEEFGKEYTTYFSILSLIASSKTARVEIEGILGKNVGGYLDRLENEYTIIKKVKPIFAKEGSRTVKYEIIDNFFNFWFRFIYKYKSAIEIENYVYVKDIVNRDYTTYSGRFLEKYFIEQLKLSNNYSDIGTYWERGNENEIDIVGVNSESKTMLIAEVKRRAEKIDMNKLQKKSIKLLAKYEKYEVQYLGYSLDDM